MRQGSFEEAGGKGVSCLHDLLLTLLNREVTVHNDGLKVSGRLVSVVQSGRRPVHRPCVLVLSTSCGHVLMRDWSLITFSGV